MNATQKSITQLKWIEEYIEKKITRFENVRMLDDTGEFSTELLKEIFVLKDMLEAYRR